MKLRKRHNVALEDISPVAKKIFLAAERVCVPDPVTCFTFEACRKTRKCRPVQCMCQSKYGAKNKDVSFFTFVFEIFRCF